jgi:hypothetical protein
MKAIDDLNVAGEMLTGNTPNPFRAIPQEDLLFRAAPAAFPGFPIDALAKLLVGLDSADLA